MLEINIIELPKLVKFIENNKVDKKDKLVLWLKFFLSPDEIGVSDMEGNEDIKKAKEELDKIKQSKREKELAELRMKYIMDQKAIRQNGYEEGVKYGREEGTKEGIEIGIKQGKKETNLKVAKDLLSLNLPVEKIMEITNLTKEEIEQIKNK